MKELIKTIITVSKSIPEKYYCLYYRIIETILENPNDREVYYTWYIGDEAAYQDIIDWVKNNGFDIEIDYKDEMSIGFIITW